MKTRMFFAALALGLAGSAVTASAQQADSHNNSMVKHRHHVNNGLPSRGANSFTERQARKHITHAGFTAVSALRKDENGIWRGTAVKDGKQTPVAVDFKGDVTTGQ